MPYSRIESNYNDQVRLTFNTVWCVQDTSINFGTCQKLKKLKLKFRYNFLNNIKSGSGKYLLFLFILIVICSVSCLSM